ncbi:AbrB/MazE/SpoVT family DNA-binding domain-containing protein [Romboutsia sp.]|uniref:AbrB/MazE/SpoVT family DNA-binding domain-containing protein n=1 Tax=Romboutsia sp. TaxID=1965302 RepID=UPI002CC42ADC|nr:AbrB/MazE/SpoVT family DNA-binding domain-containing protein [Romboutsia sp.]HSQ87234.1 AbrB/MazE/SpoVT family DNA-binding domain-containing protein [Romboutsia sp.]
MKNNSKDLSLGVERTIDDLGRLVLPKEMRDKLNFQKNQVVNIKLFKNYIQVEKSISNCSFCDSQEDTISFKNSPLCRKCLNEIIEKFNK